jgi:hypothetical protein
MARRDRNGKLRFKDAARRDVVTGLFQGLGPGVGCAGEALARCDLNPSVDVWLLEL